MSVHQRLQGVGDETHGLSGRTGSPRRAPATRPIAMRIRPFGDKEFGGRPLATATR